MLRRGFGVRQGASPDGDAIKLLRNLETLFVNLARLPA